MARLLFAVVFVFSTVLCGSLACRPVYDTERPSVETNDATDIATSVAALNGNLTSLGTASTVAVSFQWGTSSGSYTNETTAHVKKSAEEFSFELTFLSPNTTYYFRARAVGDGTVHGSQKQFTTSGAEKLTFLSDQMTTSGMYVLKVTGRAKNISSEKLNYAEVDVRFKDARGAILQTGVENTADLNPGDVWDFEVIYPAANISKVASYEISAGTIW